jgi:arylsulfatase
MNPILNKILLPLGLLILTGFATVAGSGTLDRSVLPTAEPTYPPVTELDARNAKAPPPFEVKAPKGAPNVVIVLIDDIGFGAATMFWRFDPDTDSGPARAKRHTL